MQYLVSELFDLVEKEKTQEGKERLLRAHDNMVVRTILYLNYNPDVKFHLPEGEPPFKKDKDKPLGFQETTLTLEMRRFYIWVKPETSISNLKRESLFINMLEGLHYTEAELLCLVKDKKMETRYPSISEDVVRKCFANLLPPPVAKPEPVKKSRTKKSSTSAAVA